MRTWMNRISLCGIACALLFLWVWPEPKRLEGAIPVPLDPRPDQLVLETFGHLPKAVWQTVIFDAKDNVLKTMTRRQQRDQMLDWTLLALLSDSGLDAAALGQVLHDLPPRRSGYLAEIADFEYGPTRARFLGDGHVLALIPAKVTPEQRRDHLAHIADDSRKNLGENPTTLLVFEYELLAGTGKAQVRRVDDVSGAELFGTGYGYLEGTVTSTEDLARFMESVDDLTFARIEAGALRLGGRRFQDQRFQNLGTEEVAALWQAGQKIQSPLAQLDDFKRRWSRVPYRTELEKLELEARQKREWELLKDRISSLQGSSHSNPVQGIGFSLDPQPEFDKILASFHELEPALKELAAKDGTETGQDPAPLSRTTLDRVAGELANGTMEAYLGLANELSNSREPDRRILGALMEGVSEAYQFQAARYDGNLKGTEAGMVLFYTDLLAKLWALDFECNAPDRFIEDFVPLTRVASSPVFAKESEALSNTRLWFGPLDRGFQILGKDSLLFGRNSTRVYAASSNPLNPGEETEPNADSAAFLGWWNDHYEEIALYEPQYERLNEIMKWSLLVEWLQSKEAANRLAFLANHQVRHDRWFPKWARSHPELRFRQWSEIGFFERGYRRTATEALPLLSSAAYDHCGPKVDDYYGGVSLAEESTITSRTASELEDLSHLKFLRDANVKSVEAAEEVEAFKTLGGVNNTFRELTPTRSRLVSTPRPGARLRTPEGELGTTSFTRRLERGDDWLSIDARTAEASFGRVEVGRVLNGFLVGWRNRDLDAAQALARRLSRAPDLRSALIADSEVDALVDLGEGQFAVRLQGADSWFRLAPEAAPSRDLAAGWNARISDPIAGKRNLQLAWIKDREVPELASKGKVLKRGKASDLGGTLKDPPEIAELRQGDYVSAARRLAMDAQGFNRQVDAHVKASLRRIDDSLADGRPDRALERLDELAKTVGDIPDIRLRRGLALLDQHRLQGTEKVLSEGFGRPWQPGEEFIEEINRRISKSGLTGDGWEDLQSFAQYADWQDVQAAKPGWKGTAKVFVQEDRLRLQFEVPKGTPFRKLRDDEVESLAQAKPELYIQDSKGLNNHDWPVSPGATLREISSGHLKADVFELPRGDIAHFNPATIYVPEVTSSPLRRAGEMVPRLKPQPYVRWDAQSGNGCNDDRGDCANADGRVYLVVERPAA
jgi:hypothetical protein